MNVSMRHAHLLFNRLRRVVGATVAKANKEGIMAARCFTQPCVILSVILLYLCESARSEYYPVYGNGYSVFYNGEWMMISKGVRSGSSAAICNSVCVIYCIIICSKCDQDDMCVSKVTNSYS